jgi:hypothetical protein
MFIIHTTVSATWKGDRYHKDQENKNMLQMSPYLLKNLALSQKPLSQPRKPVVQETQAVMKIQEEPYIELLYRSSSLACCLLLALPESVPRAVASSYIYYLQ